MILLFGRMRMFNQVTILLILNFIISGNLYANDKKKNEAADKKSGALIRPKLVNTDYYKKFKVKNGLLAKGSSQIKDESLEKALALSWNMVKNRPDITNRLIANNVSIAIFVSPEDYCSLPETKILKDTKTFDGRSYCTLCGAGAVAGRPVTAICEENLLKSKTDPYFGKEDILTHEFAHSIHYLGMQDNEKKELVSLYQIAVNKGLFSENKDGARPYMILNEDEFFATLSAVWFNAHNPESESIAKNLKGREDIKAQFPEMYDFLKKIYPE